jgi:hypothetical protein
MENLSSKGKGAWSTVCNQSAEFYETVDPTGCRELVDLGLMEEVKQNRSRVSFKLTARGHLAKQYDRLLMLAHEPHNFMPGHAFEAIRHILIRLGPPV